MWDIDNVRMLEIRNAGGFGIFRMLDEGDVGSFEMLEFGMWDVRDVRCSAYGMWDVCRDVGC